jgi:hypothetical protein
MCYSLARTVLRALFSLIKQSQCNQVRKQRPRVLHRFGLPIGNRIRRLLPCKHLSTFIEERTWADALVTQPALSGAWKLSVLQGGLPSAPGPLRLVTDLGGASNMNWLSAPDWVLQMCYLWC